MFPPRPSADGAEDSRLLPLKLLPLPLPLPLKPLLLPQHCAGGRCCVALSRAPHPTQPKHRQAPDVGAHPPPLLPSSSAARRV